VGFGQLFLATRKILREVGEKKMRILVNFWPFAHFLPTFKIGIGHEKTLIFRAFQGFVAKNPLLFVNL
jgi:hypothetical protein